MMEPKQILMLTILLLVAVIGSGVIMNVLRKLDHEDDTPPHENGEGH